MTKGLYCKTIVDSYGGQWGGYNIYKEDVSERE